MSTLNVGESQVEIRKRSLMLALQRSLNNEI